MCIAGIIAIVMSLMSMWAADYGNTEEARSKGKASLAISLIGIIISIIIVILVIIYIIVVSASFMDAVLLTDWALWTQWSIWSGFAWNSWPTSTASCTAWESTSSWYDWTLYDATTMSSS